MRGNVVNLSCPEQAWSFTMDGMQACCAVIRELQVARSRNKMNTQTAAEEVAVSQNQSNWESST